MKTLIELYKSAAQSVGLVSNEQGFLSTVLPGSDTPKPWMVETKRVVLPVKEQLELSDWSNRIGFHPLLQNVASGDSRVMDKFRDRMNAYADFVLGMLLNDIGKLALKEEMHREMTPPQAAYLGPFQDADARFIKLLYDLVTTKRISKKNHEFVHFSVIKGRVWEGQKRSRVAVMHFPLYEHLPADNKGVSLLGFTLRQKDVKMLRAMYKLIFPFIDTKAECEFGSDSMVGPSFEALMTIYGKFTAEINKAVGILEPVIDTSTALLIVDDWRQDIANVDKLLPEIRHIPMLEGNAPSVRVEQASAPQRIGENMQFPTMGAPVAQTSHIAPVIAASVIPETIKLQEAPMQMNDGLPPPRFKLGTSAPTVSGVDARHQLPSTMNNEGNGPAVIGYGRHVHSSTPINSHAGVSVGQQASFQNPQMMGQAQFAGNVLSGQVINNTPQAMKIPDSARMVNGVMYIPLEANGVSAAPQGSIIIDNRVYVPFGQVAGIQTGAPGMQVGMQGGFNPAQNRFGQQGAQVVTDPSQVPGLTADEINYYRSNPVMWQTVLANMQQTGIQQAANMAATRQTQVPNYLQRAVATAQQQQQENTGFFPRR